MSAAKTSRTAKPKTTAATKANGATKPAPTPVKAPPPPEADVPDPVPTGVHQVLELFKGPLSKVSFPDVNTKTLQAACDSLRSTDNAVQEAFAALEAAQARLAEEQAQLQRMAERGLAYARVFAQDDEALQEKLGAVELGRGKARKPKAKMIPKAARKEKVAEPEPEPEPSEEKKSA